MREEYSWVGKRNKGREILYMIIDWYKLVEADGAIFDFSHLNAVKSVGQDLSSFLHRDCRNHNGQPKASVLRNQILTTFRPQLVIQPWSS